MQLLRRELRGDADGRELLQLRRGGADGRGQVLRAGRGLLQGLRAREQGLLQGLRAPEHRGCHLGRGRHRRALWRGPRAVWVPSALLLAQA